MKFIAVPLDSTNDRSHRRLIVDAVRQLQNAAATPRLVPVAVADLPSDPLEGQLAYVSDDATVGGTIAWFDGTDWKRPSATANVS